MMQPDVVSSVVSGAYVDGIDGGNCHRYLIISATNCFL